MNNMWKYFECRRCGKCCAILGLPYDPKSIFDIADYFKLTVDDVIETYYGKITEDRMTWESDETKRKPCPFLKITDGKASCKIYSVRPDGCKLHPMDTDFGRSGIDCEAWKIAYDNLTHEEEQETEII